MSTGNPSTSMSPTTTPSLTLLGGKTDLSLHLKRQLSGMDPMPTTDSGLPDFVPVELLLWAGREDRMLGPVSDFGCVLWPADRDSGAFARWDGDRRNGYPASMPEWVRTIADELYASLADRPALPTGEVSIHGGWSRKFSVKGSDELSFADGTLLTPATLHVATVIDTAPDGSETEAYRIAVYGRPGSDQVKRWIAPRLQGYAEDIPAWAREAIETLRNEMVASR